MSAFWDILLLASILWILFIAGAFIYHRVIKPIKSGRASRMEEKIEKDLASRPIQWRVKNHFKSVGYKPPSKIEIATQGKPEDA